MCCVVAAAVLATAGCGDGTRPDGQLIVTGSTTLLPIAEQAAESFQKANPGTNVLVSGLGSSAGIEAVASGTSDIGTASRELNADEQGLGLVDTPVAYDGIAVIVHPDNPVDALGTDELRAVFSGEITNWSQVGGEDRRIDLVNRDEASGTREAFKKIVMKETTFDRSAVVLPGTGQVRDVVAHSKGAIGYISFGFVAPRFSKTQVKAIMVDNVAPSDESIMTGEYPISRALHFLTKGEPSGLAGLYIQHVLSKEIQEGVVPEAGFVPIGDHK